MPRPRSRRSFLKASAAATAGLTIPRWAEAAWNAPAGGGDAGADADLAALKPLLQDLVAEMERQVPYASALVLRGAGVSITVDDQTRDIQDASPSSGAVFTVYNGAWFEEAATSDLRPDSLRAAARALAAHARREKGGPEIDPGDGGDRTFRTDCEIDPRELSLRDRFDRTVELHRRARALDSTIVNCRATYSERTDEELFVNRAKAWTQDVLRLRGRVAFYASDGDRTVSDWQTRAGTGGLEMVAVSEEDLQTTAANARALLHAERIRPGFYEVVADPAVTGVLAHESFGHGVELDMFVKDRARAEQFVDRRVGSELVNILDDPSLPGAYGSYFFDDEGQPAAPTHIVKDGVFLRGISDLMSATRLNVARSANGRRQDFSRKTYARMSNTFFGAGESTLEELVAGVSRGVLLQKFTHGMEDPKGWGITVGSHIGREIVDGKLTGRLFSPVAITGYVPDVLGSVTGVGNDFATSPGTCGKGHKESVPVSSGGPHLRFTARLA